jgi:hypothetical protein
MAGCTSTVAAKRPLASSVVVVTFVQPEPLFRWMVTGAP